MRFSSFDQMGSEGGIGIDGSAAMKEILASVDKRVSDDYFSACRPEFIYVAGLWEPRGSQDGQPLVARPNPVGIAVVEKPFEGAHYLDKMATKKGLHNRGIATGLFEEMDGDCPNLIWRAKPQNENACRLYRKIADNWQDDGLWIIFWKGFEGGNGLAKAAEYAMGKEKTLFDCANPSHAYAGGQHSPAALYHL
jgi:hypothetical protein